MTTRLPPVPDDNRSPKGTGTPATSSASDSHGLHAATNPDKQGQQGNSKINTSHQGHQQDR